MDCTELLETYSEYRDGLLDASRASLVDAHLAGCGRCRRYDRVVRDGCDLARSLPPIEPSSEFGDRLQHRIFHLDDESVAERTRSGAPVAFTLAVAIAIGLGAWAPLVRTDPPVLRLPPVAAHAPVPGQPAPEEVPDVFRSGPLLSRSLGSVAEAGGERTIFFRYSPLGSSVDLPVHPVVQRR